MYGDDRIVKLLTFGLGGHCEKFSRHCTCSGYENPESYCSRAARYHKGPQPAVPAEGCYVVDVRAAVETVEGRRWVFNGPLVDVDLEDGDCEECPQPSPMLAAGVAGNQYGTLLAVHAVTKHAQKRGALDSVSIAEFVDGWRQHGARIGRLYADGDNRRIDWE